MTLSPAKRGRTRTDPHVLSGTYTRHIIQFATVGLRVRVRVYNYSQARVLRVTL
jgi:hypothetical protein